MNLRQVSFHTGPCIVRQIAEKMREAGVCVTIEGTERVYVKEFGVDDFAAREAVREALRRTHGTVFGL
jgi:hypothetical protein